MAGDNACLSLASEDGWFDSVKDMPWNVKGETNWFYIKVSIRTT